MAKFNKIFGLHSIYFIINLERKFCNCITKFYIKILFNFRHIQFIVLKKAINGIKKKKKKQCPNINEWTTVVHKNLTL